MQLETAWTRSALVAAVQVVRHVFTRPHLEKLQVEAAECKLTGDLATAPVKRDLFTRRAEHLSTLASGSRAEIAKAEANPYFLTENKVAGMACLAQSAPYGVQ